MRGDRADVSGHVVGVIVRKRLRALSEGMNRLLVIVARSVSDFGPKDLIHVHPRLPLSPCDGRDHGEFIAIAQRPCLMGGKRTEMSTGDGDQTGWRQCGPRRKVFLK